LTELENLGSCIVPLPDGFAGENHTEVFMRDVVDFSLHALTLNPNLRVFTPL
jgi:hypothetical protein